MPAFSTYDQWKLASPDDQHYYDEYEDDFEDDEDSWLDLECGLAADGQCGMAGTEHCDFTCPYRDSEDFAGSAAWNEKHKAKQGA